MVELKSHLELIVHVTAMKVLIAKLVSRKFFAGKRRLSHTTILYDSPFSY